MKTNAEIKRESFKLAFNRKWFWRIVFVLLFVGFINQFATGLVRYVYQELEVQTWMDFLAAKAEALDAGMDYAVPSRAVAMQMNYSTAFLAFIAIIFGGIALFGGASVVLKAAKEEDERWCRDSLGGFARPLGVAALWLLLTVKVFLWSLLLLVPGVVATYRYSQCWNIKVENPDWSAAKCIAESARMMKGHKMQRFMLDLHFVVMILVLAILMIVGIQLGGLMMALFYMLTMGGSMMLVTWMSVARAVFYRELKGLE